MPKIKILEVVKKRLSIYKSEFAKKKLEKTKQREKEIKKRKFNALVEALTPEIKNRSVPYQIQQIKYLARDVLITEFFINRIARQTKRPIVVLTIGNTGKPYAFSLKETSKIHLDSLDYPSSEKNSKEMMNIKKNLISKLEKYKKLNPVFIFLDASHYRRMPSSFVGFKETYTNPQQSLSHALKQQNMNTLLVGYDLSLENGEQKLPKNLILSGKRGVDAILFNPCKDRISQYSEDLQRTPYKPAFHDDRLSLQQNPIFKELILFLVDNYKENRFKKGN